MSNVTEYRLDALEGSVREIKDAVGSIAKSLDTLARLEERHQETRDSLTRAFNRIEDHEVRLRKTEAEVPTTRLVKTWVIAGITGLVGIVASMIVGKLI